MDEVDEMILSELLKQKQTAISEAYHIRTFRAYRGGVEPVTVEILDAGPDRPNARYRCRATAGDKSASGNSAESISTAIALVHWWDLD